MGMTDEGLACDLIEWQELPEKLLISKHAEVNGRCFLNTMESEHTGSMKYNIEVHKKRRPKSSKIKGFYYSIWGNIQIRDCSRAINLHLDGNTKNPAGLKLLENSKRKLLKIRKLCDHMLEAIEDMENRD